MSKSSTVWCIRNVPLTTFMSTSLKSTTKSDYQVTPQISVTNTKKFTHTQTHLHKIIRTPGRWQNWKLTKKLPWVD